MIQMFLINSSRFSFIAIMLLCATPVFSIEMDEKLEFVDIDSERGDNYRTTPIMERMKHRLVCCFNGRVLGSSVEVLSPISFPIVEKALRELLQAQFGESDYTRYFLNDGHEAVKTSMHPSEIRRELFASKIINEFKIEKTSTERMEQLRAERWGKEVIKGLIKDEKWKQKYNHIYSNTRTRARQSGINIEVFHHVQIKSKPYHIGVGHHKNRSILTVQLIDAQEVFGVDGTLITLDRHDDNYVFDFGYGLEMGTVNRGGGAITELEFQLILDLEKKLSTSILVTNMQSVYRASNDYSLRFSHIDAVFSAQKWLQQHSAKIQQGVMP